MGFHQDLQDTERILANIKGYDVDGFAKDLKKWVVSLEFFYNKIVPKTGNPDTSFFKIKSSSRPKEGQVAYFNLCRGYPKELCGDHQCYIVKDYGYKFLIVPTTSVKDGSKPNPDYEIDIKIKDFLNGKLTRLQVSDMRTIDAQRIDDRKAAFDVETDRAHILSEIKRIIF